MDAVEAADVSVVGPTAPRRSVRRATARRASTRRASARSHQHDHDAAIVDFLTDHPNRTTGDLARGLNLDPDEIATCLTHLISTGEIEKTSHGYRTKQPE